jgi:hypothetical protein
MLPRPRTPYLSPQRLAVGLGAVAAVAFLSSGGQEPPAPSSSEIDAARKLVEDAPWYGNTIGLEDEVIAPWTPLRSDGRSVACWGRVFEFADSPLPTRIVANNAELLARPISLSAATKSGVVNLQSSAATISVSPSGTRAQVAGVVRAVGAPTGVSGGGLSFSVRSSIEFDGMQLFEISETSGTLEALTIEIPLVSAHALYRHKWAPAFAGVSGALPGGTGVIDASRFIPYYWIGDNDRGLFWFAQTDAMWPNADQRDAIEVERTSGNVVLRLRILKGGQTLPPGWRFVFGLQPTPVKPLPADWRTWRLAPARGQNINIIWPEPKADSLKYYGYPEAHSPALFNNKVAAIKAAGQLAVPYVALSFLSEASPQWTPYKALWSAAQKDAISRDVGAYGAAFAMIAPTGPGWSDFIAWKTAWFATSYSLDGFYHDNTQPYGIAAPHTGTGYLRDGSLHKEYPILAYREVYKRMYRWLKQHKPRSFSIAHMSGKVMIPVLAFEDAMLNGEQFLDTLTDDYLDVIPLDMWRAEFMGRQWGVVPVFLPEFRPPYSDQVAPTRQLMALVMLHDMLVWPIWSNKAVVDEALAALDSYGHAAAQFVPYFAQAPLARANAEGVLVSGYRKDAGDLLIAANTGADAVDASVCLDTSQYSAPVSVYTWPDERLLRQPVTGCFSLHLNAKDFAFAHIVR